jgi:hypothetical protein
MRGVLLRADAGVKRWKNDVLTLGPHDLILDFDIPEL